MIKRYTNRHFILLYRLSSHCGLFSLERCNPWPHVANRAMTII